jgi:hypothetical protein
MIVEEQKILGWTNDLPKYKKSKYPQPLDNNLPYHYNVSIFCGSRGSGKTFLAVKYLYELEKRGIEGGIPPRIVLISPTAKSDSNKIFEVLKSLDDNDIIEEYTDEILKNKMAELRQDLDEGIEYQYYRKLYERFYKSRSLKGFSYEDLMLLEKNNYEMIQEPKYPNGFITFLIVDDCACSGIFKNGKSYFTNICIKNRHNSSVNIPMNILIAVQQIFNIPKTIRLNANVICLFKFGNKSTILDDLYPLVSAWTTPEQFEVLYDKATEQEHGCLIIDITKQKPIFKCGWSINLVLKNS